MTRESLSARDWRKVADFWHEVDETCPPDAAELSRLVLERLCQLLDAREGYVVFGVHPTEPDSARPLDGWRPQLMNTPLTSKQDVALVAEFMRRRAFRRDPHAEQLLDEPGVVRACRLREDLSLRDYHDSPVGWLWRQLDVGDRLTGVVPIGENVELLVGVDRPRADPCFSEREQAIVREAVRGLHRCARDVARTYGLISAHQPLTPREQEVLRHLLTGRSQKQIAEQIGLTRGSTHQVVVRIYRKFDVRSRAELMALWIPPTDDS